MSDARPPMPASVSVVSALRVGDGTAEAVVARVTFADVMGDSRTLDLDPTVAIALADELIHFVRQVGLP